MHQIKSQIEGTCIRKIMEHPLAGIRGSGGLQKTFWDLDVLFSSTNEPYQTFLLPGNHVMGHRINHVDSRDSCLTFLS